jgi:GC-rich sequence DNA-binding factor
MDEDDDDEPPLGPEGDLIPEMVSRAVVPLLVKALENGAYDPYSTPQTRRAVDLADVISELSGKDSRKYTVSSLSSPVSSVLIISLSWKLFW